MTKEIKHQVVICAPPARVFEALMDSRKHAAFTGERASISRRVGSAFRCYGSYITGFNLEIDPGKRIVQAWRSRDWPKGAYSIVTFALSKMAGGKTKLRFTQVGVPAGDYARKNTGWRTHYWEPLKRYLEHCDCDCG
ncbi:MAG TPA: SRPBCC family protein [Verrucomicrobiae bacterium]|nr:SRPBCC family protein [Verrucomicrobiae bacterium]